MFKKKNNNYTPCSKRKYCIPGNYSVHLNIANLAYGMWRYYIQHATNGKLLVSALYLTLFYPARYLLWTIDSLYLAIAILKRYTVYTLFPGKKNFQAVPKFWVKLSRNTSVLLSDKVHAFNFWTTLNFFINSVFFDVELLCAVTHTQAWVLHDLGFEFLLA